MKLRAVVSVAAEWDIKNVADFAETLRDDTMRASSTAGGWFSPCRPTTNLQKQTLEYGR